MALKIFSAFNEAKRGRPRKNPAPEGHEGGESTDHGPEGMEMKLRKAADYITLGKEAEAKGEKNAHPKTVAVQFGNGKTHEIPHEHVEKALKVIHSWKGPGKNPDERMKKLEDIDSSHERFMHHIGQMTELGTKKKAKKVTEMYKKEFNKVDENNDHHTHAAHFEDPKTGEWIGMELFTAKNDEEAVKKAHKLAEVNGKLSRVEKHEAIEEAKKLSPKQKKIAALGGDKDKLDAKDFETLRSMKKESLDEAMCKTHGKHEGKKCSKCEKAMKESVYTAANRFHAVESAIRDIMVKNRDVRAEAKQTNWVKNNPEHFAEETKDAGHKYMKKHGIGDVGDLIHHIANHSALKKYHDDSHGTHGVEPDVVVPHHVLSKHTGIEKKHLKHLEKNTSDHEGSIHHDPETGTIHLHSGA